MEFCQQMRPLLFSLRLLGFVFDFSSSEPSDSSSESGIQEHEKQGQNRTQRLRFAHKTFCVCVCSLLWLHALSHIPSFWLGVNTYPGQTSIKIAYVVWLLHCTLNATITLHGCFTKVFTSFTEVWRTLEDPRKSENELAAGEDEDESSGHAKVDCPYCRSARGRPWLKVIEVADSDCSYREPATEMQPNVVHVLPETTFETQDEILFHRNIRLANGKLKKPKNSTRSYSSAREMKVEVCDGDQKDCSPPAGSAFLKEVLKLDQSDLTPEEAPMSGHSFFSLNERSGRKLPSHSSSIPGGSGEDDPDLYSRNNKDDRGRGNTEPAGNTDLASSDLFIKSCIPGQGTYERIGVKFTVAGWCVLANNSVMLAVVMFPDISPEVDKMGSVTNPYGASLPVKLAIYLILVFVSGAWIFPIAFHCALCALLRTRFEQLTNTITSECKERFPTELERWRHEHLRLSRCVTVLDQTIGKVVMASYATNVPTSVFLLYSVVSGLDDDVLSMLTYGYYLTCNLGSILIISVAAISLHEAAHSPLDPLFFVRADKATPGQLARLQLFVSKLTGTSIGFSVFGIFHVTKETVLTLAGLLVTYFLVLLQFQIS